MPGVVPRLGWIERSGPHAAWRPRQDSNLRHRLRRAVPVVQVV
jgi:hypothetical protein